MMRVYFVYEDPLDDTGVNLSFVDVPTRDPYEALARVERAAVSGELWKFMYPDDREHPYTLMKYKMACLNISALPDEPTVDTILSV